MKTAIHKASKPVRKKPFHKITVQFLIIFSCCALLSIAFFNISMLLLKKVIDKHELESERLIIDGYNLALAMQNENLSPEDTEKITFLINTVLDEESYQVILTDMDGNLLYASDITPIAPGELSAAVTERDNSVADMAIQTDMGLYAVKLDDTVIQLAIVSYSTSGWIAKNMKNGMIPGVVVLLSILIFIMLFLLLSRGKIRYISEIAAGVKTISTGNLDYRVNVRGHDELALLAQELNAMAGELNAYFAREKNQEQLKTELMASVSHDLKSPLTAVIGYLSLLKDNEYNCEADITDYAEKAYQKSLRIKGLLQELMDFASLAGEDIKLNKQKVSLKHLLEQLISEYTGVFQQNRLRIIGELTDEDVYANIDTDYMIRVFDNLFSNALRYSPKPGKISIALQRSDGSLVFSITNQCPEIGQTELERLFDKFYRVEQSRSEETGGTGLGLAIAKRITELHGGRIWSEYARGEITFSVALADATDRKG